MLLTTEFMESLPKYFEKTTTYSERQSKLCVVCSNFKKSFRFNKTPHFVKIGEYPHMSLDQARDICVAVNDQVEQYGLIDVRGFIRLHLGLKFRGGRLKLNDYIPLQPRPRAKISKLRKRGWKPVRGLFG